MTKSEEAKFWSKILGRDVTSVYNGVPIIEIPSIEDLASREDWPDVRSHLRENLRRWWEERSGR